MPEDMVARIEEEKRARLRFMFELFKEVGSVTDSFARIGDIGRRAGLDSEGAIFRVALYLENEGLMEIRTMGGEDASISITHRGAKEMEASLSDQTRPTMHFPPVATVISVGGSISNSQIQVNSPGATQSMTLSEDHRIAIGRSIEALDADLQKNGLPGEHGKDLEAEIATTKAQLSKSKPRLETISESLKSILSIAKTVGPAAAWLFAHRESIERAIALLSH